MQAVRKHNVSRGSKTWRKDDNCP